MAMAGVDKPLRLKDLLELDCDSCSAAGFRCYPRRLCVAGAAATVPSPMRQLPNAEALRFGRSPFLRSKLSHLSRSLSRRLRGGFWKRREEEEAAAAAGSPVAAVSSCSCGCSSDSETSESSNSSERKSQSESDFSSASSESLHVGVSAATAAAGDEHKAVKRESKDAGSSSETDDKEQLSPVAVMDFPFDDEDGEDDEDVVEEEERDAGSACSASFSEGLAQLQRRKKQQQNKIRRFGSIGELGPVDLEARFAASDSDGVGSVPVQRLPCCADATAPPLPTGHRSVNIHEKAADEYSLLELLTETVSVGVDDVSERLLLDFFVETRHRSECVEFHAPTGRIQKLNLTRNGEAVRLAKGWLEGTGSRWGLKDALCRREEFVAEMERSRRWMRVSGEEREVGVVVAGLVIDELVDELVAHLVV